MRRPVLLVVLFCGVVGAVSAATWTTLRNWVDAPLPIEGRVTLHVAKGSTFRQAAQELRSVGVIRRPELLTLYARYEGVASQLKAGRHVLTAPLTPRQLVDRLVNKAPRSDVKVTIPEGSNMWQAAEAVEAAGVCSQAEFLAVAEQREGLLFPDTYFFQPGEAPQRVVGALTRRFEEVWNELRKAHPGPTPAGLDARGIVTLASLVEEEAQVASERPRIARVFYNRLAKGMRLETDPTCVYGRDTYKEVPSPKRCKDPKNAYSTYVIPGLPPSPISNPGRASLEAAMAPSDAKADAKLLFFVAKRDGTGAHHFSNTYAEHKAAVNRYLRGR